MIQGFNDIFAYVYQYTSDRVGAVAGNMLRKFYQDVKEAHALVYADVDLLTNGRLSPTRLQQNLEEVDVPEEEALMMFDEALNEYLNVCILAVKKVLGAEHEAVVVAKISEMFESA